jgi:hypothetical protein
MKNFVLLCLALASGANAFTAPNGVALPKPALHRPKQTIPASLPMLRSVKANKAAASLQLSVKDESAGVEEALPINVAALGGGGLLLFGGVSWFLQLFLNYDKCISKPDMCDPSLYENTLFFQDHPLASFLLVLTHALPFVLIPVTMKIISEKAPVIKADHPKFNPFIMNLGMAVICFGLALEFGWHVADSWYYTNNFHILNYGFYFFLISGFALWADGFENNAKSDALFGVLLLFATILYPIGNYQVVYDEQLLPFLSSPNLAKIPLYVGMTATFAAITKRGYKIFGPEMLIVFALSVGVNLFFIFQLQSLPEGTLTVDNYYYHIAHDLLGTEAGVAYFAFMVSKYEPKVLTTSADPDTKVSKYEPKVLTSADPDTH